MSTFDAEGILLGIAFAFLGALRPQSAAADLFSRGLSLRFENRTMSILVPGLVPPDADFVAEGAGIPVGVGAGEGVRLHPRAIKIILTATNELLRNPSAEDLIRSLLIESTAPALDRALFSTSPETDERPAGLLYNIAPLPPAGDLADDIVQLINAISPVSGNGQVALVCSPKRATETLVRLPRALPFPVLIVGRLARKRVDRCCVA